MDDRLVLKNRLKVARAEKNLSQGDLAKLVGVSRQIAVLAYQLGAGFVDAFTPVSASLIGVLGVARIEWGKWAKFQIKMQAFFFLMGTIFIAIAVAINFQ